ncbi:MAG: c-type cytochrome [Flavobacteriales bacterium]
MISAVLIEIICYSCGGANEKPSPSVAPSHTLNAAQIETLYRSKCSLCHGNDGRLNYAGAKDLSISTLTKEQIAAQIKYGKGTMPPQKDILSEEEMNALAEYALTLRAK